MLAECADITVVGEAHTGTAAVQVLEQTRPALAPLDRQLPEVDGLGVVRLIRRDRLPLVAFVTAFDEYAVHAFEMNAIDYLLKPVERSRLQETLERARERLEARPDAAHSARLRAAAEQYQAATATPLARIPIRKHGDTLLVPAAQIASIVAEGELLHITTRAGERHTINHRLKDLESRLDPTRFVRIERGALVNVDTIVRVSTLPGGMFLVALGNGQELRASRLQSRILREGLLRL